MVYSLKNKMFSFLVFAVLGLLPVKVFCKVLSNNIAPVSEKKEKLKESLTVEQIKAVQEKAVSENIQQEIAVVVPEKETVQESTFDLEEYSTLVEESFRKRVGPDRPDAETPEQVLAEAIKNSEEKKEVEVITADTLPKEKNEQA